MIEQVASVEPLFQVPAFLPPQYLRMVDATFLRDDDERQQTEVCICAFSREQHLQLSQIGLQRVNGKWEPFNNGTPPRPVLGH
jgi:hypothetical protein